MADFYLGGTALNQVWLGNTQINDSQQRDFDKTGLIMWLDADDASTISTSTQGGETRVSSWLDKSGNSNNATAPYQYNPADSNTNLYGPKYTSSFAPMNGRGVMNFDLGIQGGAGTDRGGMTYPNDIFNRPSDGYAMTMFIAFYTPDYFYGSPSQDFSPAFFSEGSGSGVTWSGIEFKPFWYGYQQQYANLYLMQGKYQDIAVDGGLILTTTSGSQSTWTDETAYIMGFTSENVYAAGSGSVASEMFVNTNTATTDVYGLSLPIPTTDKRLLGFNPADLAFPKNGLRGHIGEILVFNKYMDSAERTNVYNYLSRKWGI